jgi:isoleucyl-tRNA synthetase
MLSNLSDFDPVEQGVPYESMPEIDRFALHRLQEIIGAVLAAYKSYEFHAIYHRLYNYCTLDLSAFYLDILKDRLYTSPPLSEERRSAQTVVHAILDGITRLMAPILVFTTEEIWRYIPKAEGKESSVHLASLPEVTPARQDADLASRWERILDVRKEVTKALETARAEKQIGHSLDAAVTLHTSEDLHDLLSPYAEELRSVFIVSKTILHKGIAPESAVESDNVPGLALRVESTEEDKCERCWIHDPTVGSVAEHPTICKRCTDALEAIDAEIGGIGHF